MRFRERIKKASFLLIALCPDFAIGKQVRINADSLDLAFAFLLCNHNPKVFFLLSLNTSKFFYWIFFFFFCSFLVLHKYGALVFSNLILLYCILMFRLLFIYCWLFLVINDGIYFPKLHAYVEGSTERGL